MAVLLRKRKGLVIPSSLMSEATDPRMGLLLFTHNLVSTAILVFPSKEVEGRL